MTRPLTAQALAAAVLDGLPAGVRDALARCSVVTLFDEAMYAAVLRPDGGPALAELLARRLVEELPGTDAAFRVTPGVADAAWESWFAGDTARGVASVAPPLRRLADAVARHCAATGNQVEELRALLLVDQERAEDLFDRAFAECDARLDLAGCANLLAVLDDPTRQPFVGPRLVEAHHDRSRYRVARDLFRTAYLASEPSRYLRREPLEAALASVLRPDGPRVVRLHGSGGYGKSTLLRWLMARRCVPDRVPCAYVDLDHPVDPVNATRYPALLVLEIAHQLAGQMRGQPFRGLLRSYGSYRAALSVQSAGAARAATAGLGTTAWDVDGEEITEQFLDELQSVAGPAPEPALIVLDTVEEAMLRPEAETTVLTALLRRLTSDDSGLRLVVSGRRTRTETELRERDGFGPALAVEVPGFTGEESALYLRAVRHVADPALVDGIVARAQGLPWQLAVWGDVVERFPTLTPALLDKVSPELAWVVDRVVARVADPVAQWLLRYGSVLRTIRRDTAEQVLLPRIAAAFAGTPDDDPALDARPPGALPVFRTDAPLPAPGAGFAAVWDRFLRYAATTSWMWLAPRTDDTVELHPQVRDPLCRLVSARPVGRLLHRDAAAWFTDRAERDPEHWTDWTCEALFHRFQADGPAAEPLWRAAVATARRAGLGGVEIARIASEVLRDEYVDGNGDPRELPGGGAIVERTTLAAAHSERAWALCRIALRDRLPAGHPTWSQVESALDAAQQHRPDSASQPRRDAAAAALLLVHGDPAAAAVQFAAVAAADPVPSVDRCIVLMALAEAQLTTGRRTAARATLRAAVTVADTLDVREVTARLAVALAESAAMLGRLDEAAVVLDRAAARDPGTAAEPELRRARARLAVQTGRPAAAVQLATGPEPGPELGPGQAEAELAVGDPAGAAATCTRLLTGALEPQRRAEVLVLRARAHGRVLRVDAALADLESAREIAIRIGDVEGAGLCAAHAAAVLIRAIGSLRDAQQHLDDASRLALQPGSPVWARCRLLQAEVAARRGSTDAALHAAREALDTVAMCSTDPRRIAAVALAAWCWAPGLETEVVTHLTTQLPRITPDTARLTALGALPDCPVWPEWGRGLLKLALPLGRLWVSDDPEDRAWLDRRAAELMRVAGRATDAAELLWTAVPRQPGSLLAGWTWLRAADRIHPDGCDEHPAAARIPDPVTYPLLAAAQSLTLAQRRLRAGDRVGAAALVDDAEEILVGGAHRLGVWQARLTELRSQLADDPTTTAQQRLMTTATLRELGHPDPPDQPEQIEVTGSTLRVTFGAEGRLVVSADPGHTAVELPAAHPLVAGLHRESRTTGKSSLVGWVRRQLADGSLLPLDGTLALPAHGDALDVRIVAEPPFAQLPWELARIDGIPLVAHPGVRSVIRGTEATGARSAVRVLQEALAAGGVDPGPIDGLHGPLTTRALVAFQRTVGLAADGVAGPRTWAAIRALAAPGPRTVLVVRRAHDLDPRSGGTDLESAYARLGWTVHSVPREQLVAVDALVPGPVDVMHVNATMDVTGAMPYLGFGNDPSVWTPGAPETVTCSVLDDVVRRLARRGHTPLVVLDIAGRPSFGSATVRQLMLRNDFAHQLMAFGQCTAVLATGLAAEDETERTEVRLLAALTSARTADELVRELRAGPSDGRVVPWAGTALFATVSADQLPPLHRAVAGRT